MADCGISQIDDLVAGKEGALPLTKDSPPNAVAVLRDLLLSSGLTVPGLREQQLPSFASLTKALRRFQKNQGIHFDPGKPAADADAATLQRLTAIRPSAKRVFGLAGITLLLDISPFTTAHRILTLTSAWESECFFDTANWNSDGAGLSFGILQWAQSQDRLTELFSAFQAKNSDLFASIFGPLADDMLVDVEGNQKNLYKLAEVKKNYPTLSEKDQRKLVGRSKNPEFELTNSYWKPRVLAAGRATEFQQVQVTLALSVYEATLVKIMAGAPKITSERGIAFMLDLANQYGVRSTKTKHGALDYYDAAVAQSPDASGLDLLQKITDLSMLLFIKRPNLSKGVHLRRKFFLETTLLADTPYQA